MIALQKVEHVQIKLHNVPDYVQNRSVPLKHISTEENCAASLPKPLIGDSYIYYTGKVWELFRLQSKNSLEGRG